MLCDVPVSPGIDISKLLILGMTLWLWGETLWFEANFTIEFHPKTIVLPPNMTNDVCVTSRDTGMLCVMLFLAPGVSPPSPQWHSRQTWQPNLHQNCISALENVGSEDAAGSSPE